MLHQQPEGLKVSSPDENREAKIIYNLTQKGLNKRWRLEIGFQAARLK